MDDIYKNTFKNCRTYLVDNIHYDDLADLMLQDGVLPGSIIEDINSFPNRREKVRQLLNVLPRRSNETFETFLRCLIKSNQQHVAKTLSDKLNEVRSQTLSNLFENNFLPPSKESHSCSDFESLPSTQLPEFNLLNQSLSESGTESSESDVPTSIMCTETIEQHSPLTLPGPSQAIERECYEMNTTQPRGYMLVINNENFTDASKQRYGSSKDATDLRLLFWRLGFNCDIKNDLDIEEMKACLSSFSQMDEHKNMSCCALALMSHGDDNHIFGIRCKKVPVNELINYFNDQNCPNLKDKPKLFIIQACRNNNSSTSTDTRKKGKNESTPKNNVVKKPPMMRLMSLDLSSDSNKVLKEPVNSRADMLIAYSTAPGNVSYRNKLDGSIFIQTIIEVFNHKANSTSVTDMLIEVNRKLRERYPGQEQIGVPEVALTKKWYLKPT